jgi:signal transduction histidine kinase
LALHLEGPDPFAAAADRQITAYLWTGVLVIIVIAILAMLVASYIVHQVRLTGLKNDLIATVTHELKTPLASMRVLADTLLAGNVRNERQAREYVQLMARENERLSHLIDNFLTFSRMERNKRSFDFAEVNVGEIVASAVEAVGDKLRSPGCRLEVEVAPDLPVIVGDRGALVTVLINLLDNAYKYTEDDKHIVVRGYARDESVCLEVQDNGMGLSRRAAKKVFDRFYQVDQSLARRAGGCGLGLSIVKFIVEAHGGAVNVASKPGEGSTFVVRLPLGGPSL